MGQRAVAQLGSALDWGSRGRRFKSCQPDGHASEGPSGPAGAFVVLLGEVWNANDMQLGLQGSDPKFGLTARAMWFLCSVEQ